MAWIRRLFSIAALVAALPALAAESARILHSEPLAGLHFASAASGNAKTSGPGSLVFDAFGRRFALELQPNRRLIDALERQSLGAGVEAYRGRLANAPGSWLRLVIDNGQPTGIIYDGREFYAVERPAGSDEAVVFRLADLYIEPGTLACAHSPDSGSTMLAQTSSGFAKAAARAPGAVAQIDLAMLGDFEFASENPTGAEAAIVSRMNVVDGIFSEQLGVQLNLNTIDVFNAANDPFTNETDAGMLLDEVADYRFATPEQQDSGLTHLFTGRDLDGNTVGIAFTGALCRPRAGAALSEGSPSVTLDSLVAAHELGHNFGAPHDGEAGSACESTPQDFLMAPSLNGSDQFSACSIDQMQDDVDRAACITPLPTTDVRVQALQPSGNVLLGDTATVSFAVDSNGTQTANDVTAAISVPNELGLQGATASAGTCTTGGGSVDCSLGSIAGGSGETVSLTVSADTVGSFDFVATVAATDDANANNNDATLTLTVEAASDLSVTVPAAAQVSENEAVTLRGTVDNLGPIGVSDVVVTVIADAGIRVDSATLTGGNCSTVGAETSCTVASFASLASATLEIAITGITTGAHGYTIDIASTTADRDAANNAATGQVTVGNVPVSDPGGDPDSEGGGHGGGLLLLALAALGVRRRFIASALNIG